MSDEFTYPCPRCQVGQCRHSRAPYLRVEDGTLVSVPDMAIWTCDICGYHEFEREAISRLDTLMRQDDPRHAKTKAHPKPEGSNTRRAKP